MLIKNPAGCNQVISFLRDISDEFDLVLTINNRTADGTDISWLWETEFEKLRAMDRRIGKITVSGDCAGEMEKRLLKAGIPEEKIILEKDCEAIIAQMEKADRTVFIMPTYTAMLEMRSQIIKHCGGAEFWE